MNFKISHLMILVFPLFVWGQSQDVNIREGQLFTIKIIPKGKTIEVFLTGYKTAGIKFTDIGLEAYAQVGKRKLNLNVTKDIGANTFQVSRHTTVPFKLDLELKLKEKTDKFRFDVP